MTSSQFAVLKGLVKILIVSEKVCLGFFPNLGFKPQVRKGIVYSLSDIFQKRMKKTYL